MVHPKAYIHLKKNIKYIIGLSHNRLPMKYLGSPIFLDMKKNCYSTDLMVKVAEKVTS